MAKIFGINPDGIINSMQSAYNALMPGDPEGGGFLPSGAAVGGFHPAVVQGGGFQPAQGAGGGFQPSGGAGGGFQPSGWQGYGFQPAGVVGGGLGPANWQAGGFKPSESNPLITKPITTTGGSGGGAGMDFSGPATADDNANVTAQSIDNFIRSKFPGSPLAGQGAYILQRANEKGVSVALVLGIGWKESGMGTNVAAGNIFGITDPATDGGLGGHRTFQDYGGVQSEIDAAVNNLATNTYKGKSAADQIGIWYTGKAGDPNATDLAGNGSVQQYLDNFIAPVYQALGIKYNPTAGGSAKASVGATQAIQQSQQYMGSAYTNEGIRVTGNPKDGFDCSSYTGYILGLPRNLWNAQAQFDATQRLDFSQLQPGDLVFFRDTVPAGSDPSARPVTHVGLYIGNGKMINDQNDGLREADITSGYWRDHYYGGGRLH